MCISQQFTLTLLGITHESEAMIRLVEGNLLHAETDAVVNTVNCVGFMGKGIALQFKQAFPANFTFYEAQCRRGDVVPGKMTVFDNGAIRKPHFIINFPTKRHWKGNSRLEDIDTGLIALIDTVRELGITSISVPPLGCGLGGLDWGTVRPRIERAFAAVPDVTVDLYAPKGAPPAKSMPVHTTRPKMTAARALVIRLMDMYSALGYSRSLLEVQKLAYFLQEAGQPLRLSYEQGHYGPFAKNLNKVLQVMEGHFIRGLGDSQRPDAELVLMDGATGEAEKFLSSDEGGSSERLNRVGALIEGFETPYGMELLATAHWVGTRGLDTFGSRARSAEQAAVQIQAWNLRKKERFKPQHIAKAWDRLAEEGWL